MPGLHPHRRPRNGGEAHRVPEQRDRPDAGQVPTLSHTELRRAAENFFTGQVDALGGDATAPVLLAYLQSTFRTALTATGAEGSLSALEIGHAARTVLLLARSYADQCSFAEARRTLSRAASLAELAGEPSTQAIALRMLSQDALDQNQPAVALAYVRQALEIAPRAPDAVRAFVARPTRPWTPRWPPAPPSSNARSCSPTWNGPGCTGRAATSGRPPPNCGTRKPSTGGSTPRARPARSSSWARPDTNDTP